MDEETTVTPASEEQTETVETEVVEETEEVDLSVELEKERKARKDTELRAKKAEEELKKLKQKPETPATGLSTADVVALSRVHEEDVERVEKWAKDNSVGIRDALKDPELKAILSLREEQRTTAQASNVGNTRRGPSKLSDDVLIENASKGKLPDDDEGIERLIAAKRKQK